MPGLLLAGVFGSRTPLRLFPLPGGEGMATLEMFRLEESFSGLGLGFGVL